MANKNGSANLTCAPKLINRKHSRQGATAILVLFCMTALLVFGVVVLNICWLQACREKLQSTADSAAITAAKSLLVTDDYRTSTNLAIQNAGHYIINDEEQLLQRTDIEFGSRNLNDDGSYTFLSGIEPKNSAKVTARRGSMQNSPIPIFLGGIVGISSVNLVESATATFADHDVAIVIDASGMMHGPGRFSGVEELMNELMLVTKRSNVNIRFSVTLFSKDAELVLPLTNNLNEIVEIIDNVALRGPRNLGAGMQIGLESLFNDSSARGDAKKSMLILSECKSPKRNDFVEIARSLKQNNVDLDVFTFTKIADVKVAGQIATASGGEHHHALNTTRLREALKQFVTDVPVFLFQ